MGIFVGLLYLQVGFIRYPLQSVGCIPLFQTPLTIVGINNLNGALFYLVGELTYSTLFGILTCLPSDYPLVVREYHDGIYYVFRSASAHLRYGVLPTVPYHRFCCCSYYLARVLSYLPLFSVDGLVMIYVCYWMVGFSSTVTQVP